MLTQQQQLMSSFQTNYGGDFNQHQQFQKQQQFLHQQQILQKQMRQHNENPVLSSLIQQQHRMQSQPSQPQPILRQQQPPQPQQHFHMMQHRSKDNNGMLHQEQQMKGQHNEPSTLNFDI